VTPPKGRGRRRIEERIRIVKRAGLILVVVGIAFSAYGAPTALRSNENLCYNGTFDVTENPLDGWMTDYSWTGNSHYMANKTRVSAVASYKGRRNVLRIGGGGETKVESRAIPFEEGAKYRCTLEITGAMPHIYFTGYKWKPGIRPHENPHLGDLRRIYKSQFRNHKVTGSSGGWKKVTFEFPMDNPSKLAKKHLKYMRLFTVYIIMVSGTGGEVHVDNVVVKRIK
jgi:hypothetical protein